MNSSETSEPQSEMKDDWWHMVLASPVIIPVAGLIGGMIGAMLLFSVILLYPISIYYDARYVRGVSQKWQPSRKFALVTGISVMLTLGILSYVVSPYYIYKRRGAV